MLLGAAALVAVVAIGCGGDGDSTSESTVGAAGKAEPQQQGGAPDTGSGGQSGSKPGDSGSGAAGDSSESGGDSAGESGSSSGGKSGGSGGKSGGSGGKSGGSGGSGSGSSEPSREFESVAGDKSISTYGEEASDAEREAASAALEGFMAGRASGDWQAACANLSKGTIEPIEKLLAPGKGCAETLSTAAKRLPASALENTMTGPIDSFRFEGETGFALYHGTGGVDYAMPMAKEGGAWKVTLLEPTELP